MRALTNVVGYPSYRVSDPHVRVPLVLTAVDLEVVRWELVLGVDLVSSPAVWYAPLVQRTCRLLE